MWWFVVSNDTDKKDIAAKFLKYYIKFASNNKYFWKNIFSAFDKIYDLQKFNIKYRNIVDYEYDFSYILSDNIKNFKNDDRFVNALLGKYSLRILIENTDFVSKILWY